MKTLVSLAVLVISIAAVSEADSALTDSLVGLYEFENNYLDSSPSLFGNHGSPVNGPTFAAGKVGQAMVLAGTRDCMSLDPTVLTDLDFGDTNTGTATDFSISMWVRQDDNVSDPAVLSNKDWGNGNNTGINWAPKGNGIFDLNTKGTTGVRRDLDTATNSASLGVGNWSLVTMTVDRDAQTRLYINGQNTGTIPVSSLGSFSSGLPWNIGQDGTGNYGVEFTGAVDELAFWRRALSPSEANQLWNGGAGIALGELIIDTTLKLVIDRQSGDMRIENNTGEPQELIGYQIRSKAGAFDQAGWTPIAGRLDALGDKSIDDGPWIVATTPRSVSDMSELALGSGTIPEGMTVELGDGNWAKYFQEATDLTFEYAEPGNSFLTQGKIEFTSGISAYAFADLNFDGDLDGEDWTTLQQGFDSHLTGLSQAQRYRASDLNNDGSHSLDDILEFRVAYEGVNGTGSFEAMLTGVPEPGSAILLASGISAALMIRGHVRTVVLLLVIVLSSTSAEWASAANLFSQNFDGLPLGPNVDETLAGTNVWTDTPPNGWSIDDSGVPAGGVTEWSGWAFTDRVWWANAAGDQGRSGFTKGSGVIAVADPDEWDDLPHDPGTYNTFLRTPTISLSGVAADAVQLRFDSSWLPEDFQTANVTVSYDGGSPLEVLRWTSETADENFKLGATNETVTIPLDNPTNANSMVLTFGMTDAGNDWWWAIDNIEVFTPLSLQVDVQTGEMKLLGDESLAINGYEIKSPLGSLNPAGWLAGNLDAQNTGTPVSPAADFNNNMTVEGADLNIWNDVYGLTNAGDADGDGDSDGRDFLLWQRTFGQVGDPSSTWLTFLATPTQLIESYLLGNSTFTVDKSLGLGYKVNQDNRDLEFYYIDSDNRKHEGLVQYVGLNAASLTVPEPGCAMVFLMLLGSGFNLRSTRMSSSCANRRRHCAARTT